ncbi:MAG: winged helix DNA-binding domain-containing protein [Anaerolineales bacterium]|nr:winged helix DNA-binding domain-containing protein [Anaerolineales bacterium]
MRKISAEKLRAHRTQTFNLPPLNPLSSPAEANRFVDARGFVYFWPIKGIDFPNLWTAVAGERPVPTQHDDPGHITWGWKDNALDRRIWYYAKILRKKATMIALDVVPYFYALSENYGDYREDHLIPYEEGRLTHAAKQLYEAILDNGPLHTIELKQAARLTNAKASEFDLALATLQSGFKILPIGVAKAGAWKYAFTYELTARYWPDLVEEARFIGENAAREKLLELYFQSAGAARMRDVNRLFQWGKPVTVRALERLVEKGSVISGLAQDDKAGEWLVLPELCL